MAEEGPSCSGPNSQCVLGFLHVSMLLWAITPNGRYTFSSGGRATSGYGGTVKNKSDMVRCPDDELLNCLYFFSLPCTIDAPYLRSSLSVI